jgi:hypothetical protein
VRRGSFHEDRQRELLEHPGIHSVNFPSKSGDRVPSPVLGGHGDFMSARGGERLASVLHRTGPEAAHETVEMVRSGSGASTEKSKPMAKIDLMHWTPDGDGASSTGTAASVRKVCLSPPTAATLPLRLLCLAFACFDRRVVLPIAGSFQAKISQEAHAQAHLETTQRGTVSLIQGGKCCQLHPR